MPQRLTFSLMIGLIDNSSPKIDCANSPLLRGSNPALPEFGPRQFSSATASIPGPPTRQAAIATAVGAELRMQGGAPRQTIRSGPVVPLEPFGQGKGSVLNMQDPAMSSARRPAWSMKEQRPHQERVAC